MTDLSTAAQQALEALKVATTPLAKDRQEVLRAVAALKAALTQQDEPVWMHPWPPVRAQQAEPVEPVAHFGSAYVNENGVHITTVLGPVAIPQDAKLYTAPPQRKPLTQEEIPALAEKAWTPSVYCDAEALLGTDGLVALVRAVEAKHNIKE